MRGSDALVARHWTRIRLQLRPKTVSANLSLADYTSLSFAKRRAVFQYESPLSAQLILDERIGLLTMRLDGRVTPDMVCASESAAASSL